MNHWVALLIGFVLGALFGGKVFSAVGLKA